MHKGDLAVSQVQFWVLKFMEKLKPGLVCRVLAEFIFLGSALLIGCTLAFCSRGSYTQIQAGNNIFNFLLAFELQYLNCHLPLKAMYWAPSNIVLTPSKMFHKYKLCKVS